MERRVDDGNADRGGRARRADPAPLPRIGRHRCCGESIGPAGDPIDIMLPQRTRRARLPDVVIHRPRDMAQLRPVWRRGIADHGPVANASRPGRCRRSWRGCALVRFVVDGYVTPRAVRAALVRHSQHGRHGVVALREALDRWSLDDKPADSDLEALMGEILDHVRPSESRVPAIVGGYEVDFLIIGTNVVIECDGWTRAWR